MERCQAAKRADRNGVVAAHYYGHETFAGGVRDATRDALAGLLDLAEEAGLRVALFRRLRDGDLDVAPVGDGEPESREPVIDPGVANRGRAHVDAAPPGTEIERRADDGQPPVGHPA